jgi:MerR family transcriptional regulator, mercuric resistance operon regulatory protein
MTASRLDWPGVIRLRGAVDSVAGYRVHAGRVRTSEVAALAAVNPQTLRYYERRGLLAEPVRSPGGYRTYPAEAVRRVRFIKRAQELGFTLSEVETLLHLADGGPDGCDQVRSLAGEKISDLELRIEDLRRLSAALTRLAATCDRPRGQRECPILHELDRDASPNLSAVRTAAGRTDEEMTRERGDEG